VRHQASLLGTQKEIPAKEAKNFYPVGEMEETKSLGLLVQVDYRFEAYDGLNADAS